MPFRVRIESDRSLGTLDTVVDADHVRVGDDGHMLEFRRQKSDVRLSEIVGLVPIDRVIMVEWVPPED